MSIIHLAHRSRRRCPPGAQLAASSRGQAISCPCSGRPAVRAALAAAVPGGCRAAGISLSGERYVRIVFLSGFGARYIAAAFIVLVIIRLKIALGREALIIYAGARGIVFWGEDEPR